MSHKKKYFSRFLRFSVKLIFFSFLFYFLIVIIGGYIWTTTPNEISMNFVNPNPTENQNIVEIYITSNGLHTDIVIPIETQNQLQNKFFTILNQDSVMSSYFQSNYKWLSVGWGDKGFYNESYNGNFPSVPTILNAALLPSETLMHIDFYRNNLKEGEHCKKIKLKKEEYQNLLQHIEASFRTVNENTENQITKFASLPQFVRLPQKGYSKTDYFFEAKGNYHLFYTCNSWTNEGLLKANRKTAHFAPFAQTILYHLN